MTEAERSLWRHLRLRNIDGFKFCRQHEISPYVVDFACIEAGLVIEIDGGQHAETIAYDAARTEFLQKSGFRVLRFWNSDVLGNIDSVMQSIWTELHEDEPPS
jgi:very-short-patch-repair endonuclease